MKTHTHTQRERERERERERRSKVVRKDGESGKERVSDIHPTCGIPPMKKPTRNLMKTTHP